MIFLVVINMIIMIIQTVSDLMTEYIYKYLTYVLMLVNIIYTVCNKKIDIRLIAIIITMTFLCIIKLFRPGDTKVIISMIMLLNIIYNNILIVTYIYLMMSFMIHIIYVYVGYVLTKRGYKKSYNHAYVPALMLSLVVVLIPRIGG